MKAHSTPFSVALLCLSAVLTLGTAAAPKSPALDGNWVLTGGSCNGVAHFSMPMKQEELTFDSLEMKIHGNSVERNVRLNVALPELGETVCRQTTHSSFSLSRSGAGHQILFESLDTDTRLGGTNTCSAARPGTEALCQSLCGRTQAAGQAAPTGKSPAQTPKKTPKAEPFKMEASGNTLRISHKVTREKSFCPVGQIEEMIFTRK